MEDIGKHDVIWQRTAGDSDLQITLAQLTEKVKADYEETAQTPYNHNERSSAYAFLMNKTYSVM